MPKEKTPPPKKTKKTAVKAVKTKKTPSTKKAAPIAKKTVKTAAKPKKAPAAAKPQRAPIAVKKPSPVAKPSPAAKPLRAPIPAPALVKMSPGAKPPAKPVKQPVSTKAPKGDRLVVNMKKTILQCMSGRRFKPMRIEELFNKLQVHESLKHLCNQIITDMIVAQEIQVHKNLLSLYEPTVDVVSGLIRMHPKGFGFVIPDNPAACAQDIFIPKHLTDGAVDGDHVEVLINLESTSEKGPEGKIHSILKRARKHLAGTIRHISTDKDIVAYVPLLGNNRPAIVRPLAEKPLKIGDRVIMQVAEWGDEKESPVCDVTHILGNIEDPSIDVTAAVEEFDLRSAFPKSVLEQAKKYGKKVPAAEMKKRVDLSELECFTIDPDTAKDFDDALNISKDRKGIYSLGVHIADVAHYVQANTPLDIEASQRCNSTYFPGTCVPMLPEELSNELCSLKPDVVRLTVSVLMKFDKNGTLLSHEIVRSCIQSAKRFTYGEAKEVLDAKKKSPHSKSLKLLVELCELLKKKRNERGSIDFAMPELVVIVDEKGVPEGMKKIEYDITHQLVEEFMLKANEVVATELTKRGKPVIYRIHEDPQEENFEDFLQFARTLGLKVPVKPTSVELQRLFEEAKKTPFFQQLSIAFIRSMKLAQYSPENVGHFGLALEYYCHFTSPIRRYTDLIIQRLLFDEEPEDLDAKKIAQQSSDQERVSFRAEMSVKTLKKLRLLNGYFHADPAREFNAVVTKIKPFGLYFEIQEMMFEGFLHISELENDYFIYDEDRGILYGRGTGKVHRLGEVIQVRLGKIDLITLEANWVLGGSATRRQRPSHFRNRRR